MGKNHASQYANFGSLHVIYRMLTANLGHIEILFFYHVTPNQCNIFFRRIYVLRSLFDKPSTDIPIFSLNKSVMRS